MQYNIEVNASLFPTSPTFSRVGTDNNNISKNICPLKRYPC